MALHINVNTGNINGSSNSNAGNDVSIKNNISEIVKNALIKESLTQGSYFNGKIQDIIGSKVKITLESGQTLSAVLENDINFNIGDNIKFFVKSNNGSKILLQSVAGNDNIISQSLVKSLESIGLEFNERNTAMVKEMMALGMSLDSETVANMEKIVNSYPESSVNTLVSMGAHNIPVSSENIGQFEAYQNYKHSVSEEINSLVRNIIKLWEENPKLANEILDKVIDSLDKTNNTLVQAKGYEGENKINTDNAKVADMPVTSETVLGKNVSLNENNAANLLQKSQYNGSGAETTHQEELNVAWQNKDNYGENQINQSSLLNHTDKAVNDAVADFDLQNTENNKNDINTVKYYVENDVLKNFQTDIKEEITKKLNYIKERWMLDSDSITEKKGEEIKQAVSDKISKIYSDTGKIAELLKEAGLEKTDVYKAAQNIRSNINFMNDLSSMTAYVQVPYKTYEGETNGELYVFNKNRNKTLEDGPITAFLHLDLDNLGATDVRVTMDIQGRVSTKFTLSDAISQEIVEKNLPWLKARLEKQGYTVDLTTEVFKGNEKSAFEKILEVDRPRNEIKRYGFDIRL